MRHLLFALCSAASVASLSTVALGQITPVGPFTGEFSEDFESLLAGQFNGCHATHILGGTAELCPVPAGNLFVVGTAHCSCALQPQGQVQAFSGNGAHTRINFLTPAVSFGGEFALNCTIPDGRVEFFDPSGALIATIPIAVPNNCTWHWHGFQAAPGVLIGSVELFSNHPNNGVLVMDNLEADYAVQFEMYCTAKPNSMNCVPRLEVRGTPEAGATSGWEVSAVRVAGGHIPGTLIYTVNAARAAVPFQCGTLCVGPSNIRRAIPALSGPGIFCEGVFRIDMNTFATGGYGGFPSASLSIPGTVVHCQWWGRDNGFAPPCNSTLSNGVEYVIE